ncbi:MAG: hypothetical protein RSA21_09940, partial [Akkermansia sp.]
GAYTLKSLNLTGGSLNMGGTGSAQALTINTALTLKNGILILGHAGALGATNSLVVNGKATLKSTLTNGAYTLKSLNLTGGSLNMGGTGSAQALTINTALTLGGSLGIDVGTTLDTINYTGTTALTGALTLDVNLIGAANQAYNFLTSTTGLVDEATLTLNMLNRGATATTSFSADKKTIIITVANSGSIGNLTWGGTASSNVWETKGSAPWAGGTEGDNKFYMGDNVTFGSTGTKAISIAGQVTPGTIDITGNDYVFSGSGSIAGSGAMHINIGGEETNKTVTFNTNNAGYSGAIT